MANQLLPPGRSDPLPLPPNYALNTGGGFKNTNRIRIRQGRNVTTNGRQGPNVGGVAIGNDPNNGNVKDFPPRMG